MMILDNEEKLSYRDVKESAETFIPLIQDFPIKGPNFTPERFNQSYQIARIISKKDRENQKASKQKADELILKEKDEKLKRLEKNINKHKGKKDPPRKCLPTFF
jgi:hypothetical protein